MEKTKSKCGYTVYKATADDTRKLGGAGICDYCGKYSGSGYLIPVVSSYYCPKCYTEWDNTARYYEEDIPVQDRTAAYYESCIQGKRREYMHTANKPVKRAVWKDHKIIGYVSISLEDKDFLNGIRGGFYLGFTDEEHEILRNIREGGKNADNDNK